VSKHNVDLLESWFRGNRKKADSMHPIFKEVWIRYMYENKSPTYNYSFIVGNDPRHIRKWYVVHVFDGFSEDVREENVIWKLSQVPDPENGNVFSYIFRERVLQSN
jgi:hypothetical protein